MSLEQQVTRGYAVCIYPINRSVQQNELSFGIVDEPETNRVSRLLKFSGIENYSERWDEEADHEGFQLLIGLDEYQENDFVRYVIALDEVEIIFTCAEAPSIVEYEHLETMP